MVGAFILLAVPEALKFLAIPDTVAAPMRQIIYGALLILFMFVRPEGILGRARARPPGMSAAAPDPVASQGVSQGLRRHSGRATTAASTLRRD